MQRMQQYGQYGTPVLMNLHFCNPGQYNLNLSINIETSSSAFQYNHPPVGMPQQQMQGIEYGHVRQMGNAYNPFNGYCFPRPESDSSLLDGSSYSSGLSTPGITSNSWSYTSPDQIFPNSAQTMSPRGQQFNNARLFDGQQYSFTTGDTMNNGYDPTMRSAEFPVTSTPTKTGCFPTRNCAII